MRVQVVVIALAWTALSVGLVPPCAALEPDAGREDRAFPLLGTAPYPAQHVDPRASDFVPGKAPVRIEKVWEALTDSSVAQPCSSGPDAVVYCTLGWDLEDDRCNLRTLDATTGAQLWEDRLEGKCLLDGAALLTNPLVDVDGNLFVADSRQIASFTKDGQLRWVNPVPSQLESPRGFPNPPLGLNMLPSGELVTATIGDGYLLILDRDTGALMAEPFDLPSSKRAAHAPPPPGFMGMLAGRQAIDLLWAIALGGSSFEVDNNVAVDPHTALVFVTGGAPAPNEGNHGALWAIEFDGTALRVAFYVEFGGQGGIATTPTVLEDGSFVVVGDNQENLVVVDIPACAALPAGNRCDAFASAPLGEQLGASVVATPTGRIILAQPSAGLRSFDVRRSSDGRARLIEGWRFPAGSNIASSVVTGFDNVVYFALSNAGAGTHELVAIDIESGSEISRQPAGDFANLTMASDRRWLLTNNINFFDELAGRRRPAGVWGWHAVPSPIDGRSDDCRTRVARLGGPKGHRAVRTAVSCRSIPRRRGRLNGP